MLLEGKVAIVTGGTRGIGRAIVEKFLENGACVLFTGTSSVSPEMEARLKEIGGEWQFVKADASSSADAEQVVKTCMEKFGRVDVLVNNAGITRDTLLMRMSEEMWDEVMRVNLKSVYPYGVSVSE